MGEIYDAVIINGNACCSKCKEILGRKEGNKFIVDTETGISYNLFIRKCSKCNRVSQYCTDIGLTKRVIIPQGRIKVGKVTTGREDD
ncbi:hypothetical protein [Clostridium sp. 1001283B150210_160208_E6]|uniref:hypothetical protein n=1 Tax=Clostridium sp. 1001283B150210_160208_E6 TaxID=2787129 RepID=UPI0018AAFEAA|nr:hypothetical protein [Clostridium sp. 1001283B150210_160208_E6]